MLETRRYGRESRALFLLLLIPPSLQVGQHDASEDPDGSAAEPSSVNLHGLKQKGQTKSFCAVGREDARLSCF